LCTAIQIIKANMLVLVALATALQLVGTTILALFSFYGIKISENEDAYIEGVQKVEVSSKWLRASQVALLLLLFGILIAGGTSLAGAA
jgi:hypothetical protein